MQPACAWVLECRGPALGTLIACQRLSSSCGVRRNMLAPTMQQLTMRLLARTAAAAAASASPASARLMSAMPEPVRRGYDNEISVSVGTFAHLISSTHRAGVIRRRAAGARLQLHATWAQSPFCSRHVERPLCVRSREHRSLQGAEALPAPSQGLSTSMSAWRAP